MTYVIYTVEQAFENYIIEFDKATQKESVITYWGNEEIALRRKNLVIIRDKIIEGINESEIEEYINLAYEQLVGFLGYIPFYYREYLICSFCSEYKMRVYSSDIDICQDCGHFADAICLDCCNRIKGLLVDG